MRRLVPACVLGLVLGAAPAVALADDRPSAVPPGRSSVDAPAFSGPAAGPLQAARLKAKSTGKPVTVDELTSETSTTVARPDGKLVLTSSLLPVRVKRGGAWADVDTALVRNGDGSFSPKATPSGVKVSGGGTGPLATLTDREGRSLALTFPVALPRPTVTGGTALYAEVLKGVDLRVEVGDQGGVREVLVVKNAEAAANPALRSLRFGTSSTDLVVSSDEHGAVTAATADGTAAFRAPAPIMWDSATDAPAAPTPAAEPTAAAKPTAAPAPAGRSAAAAKPQAAAPAEAEGAAPPPVPAPAARHPADPPAPGPGAPGKP
ncbi:hypothetical protein ACFVZ3_14760, partial [Kitasatospora purpeofusca]